MKRALLAISLLVSAAVAQGQRLPTAADQNAALRDYAGKVLPRCPAGVLTLEPVQGGAGPVNFTAYVATVRSEDKYCGTQKYVLYSSKTNQVLIGSVIPVEKDGRPTADRLTDKATELLGKKVKATVSPFPLPDGLKAVTISNSTPYGSFSYNGFVDQSEQYLMVAFRGNLLTDPAKTLREMLGATTGAKRGTGKVEILELSDFQCPTCAAAHEKIEPFIQKNLGKMNYVRIDLPLFEHHEWSFFAAMGARALQQVAPTKYWQYADYVFKNQETIGKRKFDEVFKEFAEDHDLNWAALDKIYSSKTERQALLDQVSRAFAAGIASTPTYIVNGQIMGFGPEGSFTIESIKSALGTSAAPAKAAAKKKTGK